MKYNSVKIGARIKALRKSHKMSLDALGEKLHITRQTLSNIEKGAYDGASLSVGLLADLAQIFDCEIGYLLCEYDMPTREAVNIADATGLSYTAIQTLKKMDSVELMFIEALLDKHTYISKIIAEYLHIIAYDHDIQCAFPLWNYIDDLIDIPRGCDDEFPFWSEAQCNASMYMMHQYYEDIIYGIFLNPKFFNLCCCNYDQKRAKETIPSCDFYANFITEQGDITHPSTAKEIQEYKQFAEYMRKTIKDAKTWNYWKTLRLSDDHPLLKYMPDRDAYCTEDDRPYFGM